MIRVLTHPESHEVFNVGRILFSFECLQYGAYQVAPDEYSHYPLVSTQPASETNKGISARDTDTAS